MSEVILLKKPQKPSTLDPQEQKNPLPDLTSKPLPPDFYFISHSNYGKTKSLKILRQFHSIAL